MSRLASYALCISLIVVLAGCGGETTSVSRDIVPLSSNVRQMQSGDNWTYSVTGSVSASGSSSPVSGDMTLAWTSETAYTLRGQAVCVMETKLRLKSQLGEINRFERRFVRQDAYGTIWCYGADSGAGPCWIVVPHNGCCCSLLGPMTERATWGETLELTSGECRTEAYRVVAIQTVGCPVGNFDTYVVNGTGCFAGMPATTTEWFAPQIAAPIQGTALAVDSEAGMTFDLTYHLTQCTR